MPGKEPSSSGQNLQQPEGVLPAACRWLDDYFAGKKPSIGALPLQLSGTPFRLRVWERLCAIPYGESTTYGAIAQEIMQHTGTEKMSAQAVGGAVGHNPISIIVPCHRVLGAHGELTGYAGGLERKTWLLHHEGIFYME